MGYLIVALVAGAVGFGAACLMAAESPRPAKWRYGLDVCCGVGELDEALRYYERTGGEPVAMSQWGEEFTLIFRERNG